MARGEDQYQTGVGNDRVSVLPTLFSWFGRPDLAHLIDEVLDVAKISDPLLTMGEFRATCSILGWDPREKSFSASVGELNANCEAKIMAEDGATEILERNKRGELWVRAQNVMKGYWHNPKATEETKTEDGWLRTGDIAYVDGQGKFHVVDRMKVSGNISVTWKMTFLVIIVPDTNEYL